ncbi:hypothetical protein YQE_00675, partial [Dendroctonus ponderosae]
MKGNDGETSTLHSRQEEPMGTRSAVFCPPGFRMGMYGWRKKCLYGLILVLLFMVIVNLALTLWVLKVLDFSTDGMGQLEVVPGGLKLKGNAFVLDNLIANQIRSRSGEPIVIESSRNITLRSRDKLGRSSTVVHMATCIQSLPPNLFYPGIDSLECLANKFQILDDRGGLMFSADRREVVVGAETLRITGEGGSRFSGSVQTRLVRAESGHDLSLSRTFVIIQFGVNYRLESPTRGLQIRAPKELKLESRGGHINALAQNDVSFRSEMGAIRLQSSSIIVPQLPTAKVTNRQVGARSFEVFQLCACENGKLFLADPHVVCASENEDSFCR